MYLRSSRRTRPPSPERDYETEEAIARAKAIEKFHEIFRRGYWDRRSATGYNIAINSQMLPLSAFATAQGEQGPPDAGKKASRAPFLQAEFRWRLGALNSQVRARLELVTALGREIALAKVQAQPTGSEYSASRPSAQ
jgi:hypothetical protein